MGRSNELSYQAISLTQTQSQLYTATSISLFVLIEFWLKILNFSLKNWGFRKESVNLNLQTLLNVFLILWMVYFLNFFRETKTFLLKPFSFLFFSVFLLFVILFAVFVVVACYKLLNSKGKMVYIILHYKIFHWSPLSSHFPDHNFCKIG